MVVWFGVGVWGGLGDLGGSGRLKFLLFFVEKLGLKWSRKRLFVSKEKGIRIPTPCNVPLSMAISGCFCTRTMCPTHTDPPRPPTHKVNLMNGIKPAKKKIHGNPCFLDGMIVDKLIVDYLYVSTLGGMKICMKNKLDPIKLQQSSLRSRYYDAASPQTLPVKSRMSVHPKT